MKQAHFPSTIILHTLFLLLFSIPYLARAQGTCMDLAGAIQIANTEAENPPPGTIRWTGKDFQGWNGEIWVSFTNNKITGTVTDIDDNVYKTMGFGNKIWMTENLKVSKYNDGSHLPRIDVQSTWLDLDNGAWCMYNNLFANNDNFGKLYNHFAVASEKLCPIGWYIPTKEDWEDLIEELGGKENAATIMKDIDSGFWNSIGLNASNSSGFSARPSGFRAPANGIYAQIYNQTSWWASEPGLMYSMSYNTNSVGSQFFPQIAGIGVRCVKPNLPE